MSSRHQIDATSVISLVVTYAGAIAAPASPAGDTIATPPGRLDLTRLRSPNRGMSAHGIVDKSVAPVQRPDHSALRGLSNPL